MCLYGFLPKGTLQSTQHRDIGNWNIKNLDFTGVMVKVQGSRMPEHVENMRIISERRELRKKGPQNLSKVPFNFMADSLFMNERLQEVQQRATVGKENSD